MTVELLLFAALRDLAGRGQIRMALPSSVTCVGDFVSFVEQELPALAGRLGSVRVAVNERFETPDAKLSSGDVIALIPPVAGG